MVLLEVTSPVLQLYVKGDPDNATGGEIVIDPRLDPSQRGLIISTGSIQVRLSIMTLIFPFLDLTLLAYL